MNEIPKAYDPKEVEDKIYKIWEESGAFNPDNLDLSEDSESFSIAMPPPNVTGVLHLGHALESSLMDTMIRYQRMRGKKTLLVPGTDHAAVATQAKVEKDLVKSGKYKNPRQELGREKLLEIIREYSEKSKATILSQIRKMGTSCDWGRLAYTFDATRSRAVNEIFTRMYNDGLIYRGYRVVNWSVKGQSTCSDDELVYVERSAKLYTFKYSTDFPISIATTRPETKLGDTAVAVNPKDERYKKYIGKIFKVDVGAEKSLEIKIIADKDVDSSFGTGALGVTPAHSMIDYEMAIKNKLPIIKVIGEDGKMTKEAGKNYEELAAEDARKKFIDYLKKEGLLEKEEDIKQNIGTSDRFGDIIEVIPMTQWFVDVNKKIPGKNKSLKDLMREAVTIGHNGKKKQKIKITPDRFEKIYLHWIENLRDWCISRQIWWGHRIPVWYKKDSKGKEEIYCASRAPEGEGWVQDPDTLDTWFSSGTWTFSILGFPDKTKDLKEFHPTSWMQMGSEIIFFWMARMILMSTYALDGIPFKDVYIHGILRDKEGRKFSKSLGNGIDPLDIINKYGTDALRMSLIIGNTAGNDARFYEEKVEGYRNFVNKLWNISRFVLSSAEAGNGGSSSDDDVKKILSSEFIEKMTLSDKWILHKLSELVSFATKELDKFNFSAAGEEMTRFMWDDLADWYLEAAKAEIKSNPESKKTKDIILKHCLRIILKLMHPFMPFVTEEVWSKFNHGLIMVEKWPEFSFKADKKDIQNFELIKKTIIAIRNLRSENKIDPAKKIKAIVVSAKTDVFDKEAEIIKKLCQLEELNIGAKKTDSKKMISSFIDGAEVYLPIDELIDKGKELLRIEKDIKENEKKIAEAERNLANKNFIERAPKKIVEETKEKLSQGKNTIQKLLEKKKLLS